MRIRPSAEANDGSNAWVTGRPEFEREPRRHITAARVSANPRRHRSQPIVEPYVSSVVALFGLPGVSENLSLLDLLHRMSTRSTGRRLHAPHTGSVARTYAVFGAHDDGRG